jgi:hypothetical protein
MTSARGFSAPRFLSSAIGLDRMRQENAGAKQSEERDCYLKHRTHPYATSPRWLRRHKKPRRLQDDYAVP